MYLEQMETSLANVLSEYGYFDESTIRFYTKQILCGLEYLHSKKIKHLDLKCSNILTNNDGIVKLCDFGSAREFKKGSNSGSSSFTSLKS
jgi:serine/threonine protein kinase